MNEITIGCITNYGMGAHIPGRITLSVSDDNQAYTQVAERSFTPEEIFREGIRIEDKTFDNLKATGRYLRVALKNPGKCPDDHTRPGQGTWMYIDEVTVQ